MIDIPTHVRYKGKSYEVGSTALTGIDDSPIGTIAAPSTGNTHVLVGWFLTVDTITLMTFTSTTAKLELRPGVQTPLAAPIGSLFLKGTASASFTVATDTVDEDISGIVFYITVPNGEV